MKIFNECNQNAQLLTIYEQIEACRMYLDTQTEELIVVPSQFFSELKEDTMQELLQKFPRWWIDEMMPYAKRIYEDQNNRFVKVSKEFIHQ